MTADCEHCEEFKQKINWYRAEMLEMTKKLQAAESRLKELAELLVDAEIITRSRCHEITGMSHGEIVKLMADSPIAKESRKDTARECAEIAGNHQPQEFEDGCGTGRFIARTIRARFGLEEG